MGGNGFYPRVPQFAEAPPNLRPEEMFLVVRNGVRYSGSPYNSMRHRICRYIPRAKSPRGDTRRGPRAGIAGDTKAE